MNHVKSVGFQYRHCNTFWLSQRSQKIEVNKVYCDIAEIAMLRNRVLGVRGFLAPAGGLS